jgi:hypothetical protein
MSVEPYQLWNQYIEVRDVMLEHAGPLEKYMLNRMHESINALIAMNIQKMDRLEYRIKELEKELVFKDS